MKLAIMQPYFFPYIGYFSLMHYADKFVVFDTPQYDRKGWMNRNRILKPDDGWQYVRAGVIKPEFKANIKDVFLDKDDGWKDAIIRQIDHYKSKSPYFSEVKRVVKNGILKKVDTLSELNVNIINVINDYIGINCSISIFSQMNCQFEVEHAGQWALEISKVVNSDEYINPIGGADIFVEEEFRKEKIKLSFLKHNLPEYDQKRKEFIAGLSIIDVLMFNSVEEINSMLNDYELG